MGAHRDWSAYKTLTRLRRGGHGRGGGGRSMRVGHRGGGRPLYLPLVQGPIESVQGLLEFVKVPISRLK